MPRIFSTWAKFGMMGYNVTMIESPAPYSILTLIFFESQEHFQMAFNDSGAQLSTFVPCFSNRPPIRWAGKLLATA